ncbi:unnamed protein product [Coregonus sp. 'balchen']|uniref:Uncharacterized protein n=1 Tax=Coregonus suidteri TaxID=861788 RepID=A0AAN8Q8V1_9TELE|nr:unnamed protein product [Coregonus sp. 'balchen']
MEGTQAHTKVPSYLGWSIFNTLCCCLPIGIVAIICSCRADKANAVGEATAAAEASRIAKILNIVGLVIGIVLLIIIVAVKLTGGA